MQRIWLFFLFGTMLIGIFVLSLAAINTVRNWNRLDVVLHPDTGYTFPSSDNIAQIYVHRNTVDVDFDEFDVPANHWPGILATLSPSQHDREPAAWQGLASLEIRTVDAKTVIIEVYDLGDEPIGAFAVDSPPPHGRRLYRGGNTRRFKEALIAASEDARE